jgi:protein-S-isoprenylcysteine O-methyltransferase Ste14
LENLFCFQKTTGKLHLNHLKIPPALIGAGFALIQLVVARQIPRLAVEIETQIPIALFVAAIGFGIAIFGVLSFKKAATTVNPLSPEKTRSLVKSGVYSYSRNPMYLGMMIVLVAWSIYIGNVASTAIVVLFWAYITHFQIKPEEEALNVLFPEDFRDYCQNIRRWL